ncbi:hypothetical protein GCM10027055_10800 [Janibacter alkaliphilus]
MGRAPAALLAPEPFVPAPCVPEPFAPGAVALRADPAGRRLADPVPGRADDRAPPGVRPDPDGRAEPPRPPGRAAGRRLGVPAMLDQAPNRGKALAPA